MCESAQYSQEPRDDNPNARINRLNKCLGWHKCERSSERLTGQKELLMPRPHSQTPGDKVEKTWGQNIEGICCEQQAQALHSNPTVHVFLFPSILFLEMHMHLTRTHTTNDFYVLLNEQYVQASSIDVKIEVIWIIII